MKHEALIGADIGGTKISLALATREGRVVATRRLPTRVGRGPRAIVDDLVGQIESLCEEASARPLAVGVGCTGLLDVERGLVLSSVNLPDWVSFPLAPLLGERLGVPVAIENDANLAALGEHTQGAGRGLQDIFYLTISTGIGGAVIVNNQLVRGAHSGAGEVGHYTVDPAGPLCVCGARGCLNVLCSGRAIAERAREALRRGAQASSLRGDAELTAKEVAEAAARGDAIAQEVWDETIHYLSLGISAVVAVLAPEAVIVGGGVARCGVLLLDPLRAKVREHARSIPADSYHVELAALGDDSGLYGALELARRALP